MAKQYKGMRRRVQRALTEFARKPPPWPMMVLALLLGVGIGFLLARPSPPPSSDIRLPEVTSLELAEPGAPAVKEDARVTPRAESPDVATPSQSVARPSQVAPEPSLQPYAQAEGQPPGRPLPPAMGPPAMATVPPRAVPRAAQPTLTLPAWRRNAVAVRDPADRPMVAVVIDDMGLDARRSTEAWQLPGPLTLSFLPYGRELARQTAAARDHGHELMVHVSMQPHGQMNDAGPNVLMSELPPAEIQRRLAWALDSFSGYVGINNHMGSRFTTDRAGMQLVMTELKTRGLLFLDSRTGAGSVGESAAAAAGVPHAGRHVFLDNDQSVGEVRQQLAEAERIARRAGIAIAIGHPHDATIAALREWLPGLEDKGLALVPVSAVVARLEERRAQSRLSASP